MSRLKLLLGVDLGTTGVRCVVFDETLAQRAVAYQEMPPNYLGDGRVEQDAEAWVAGAIEVIDSALAELDRSAVAGLSVSSQGITVVPVDDEGKPLHPSISWLDTRAASLMSELAQCVSPQELGQITGKPWSELYTLPKVMWLQRNGVDSCSKLLMPMDYLIMRLAGLTPDQAVTDHTMAGGTMAYNVAEERWDETVAQRTGVPVQWWPRVVNAGERAGVLIAEFATRLGLSDDVVVAVGAQDQKCASLGAGIAPGVTTVSLGTSAAVISLLDRPQRPEGVPLFRYLEDHTWVAEGAVNTAGAALRWFLHTATPAKSFDELNEFAAAARPEAAPLFFPHLAGEAVEGEGIPPAGVMWGMSLDTTPADMAYAVFEGVAFEVEAMRRRLDSGTHTLRLFGGGAQGPVWSQLLADVSELPVEVPQVHEAAALGAAMLAARGAGVATHPNDTVARRVEPRPKPWLADRFERWMELRGRLYPAV